MVTVILLQQSFSRRSIYCNSQNVVDRDPYFAFAQIFLNSSKRSSEEASESGTISGRRRIVFWHTNCHTAYPLAVACVLLNGTSPYFGNG